MRIDYVTQLFIMIHILLLVSSNKFFYTDDKGIFYHRFKQKRKKNEFQIKRKTLLTEENIKQINYR